MKTIKRDMRRLNRNFEKESSLYRLELNIHLTYHFNYFKNVSR